MRHTNSQRDKMTAILEEEAPARADFELLDDGSLLVTLWRDGQVRWSPYLMRRLGRRGETLLEARRTATGWSEFTGPADNMPRFPRDSDEATTSWMRS